MAPKNPVEQRLQSQPRLIVISAPSGAGKTTLCQMLLSEFSQIKSSISLTTRKKRPNEVDGIHYHFITRKEFEAKRDKGEMAEWAVVHSELYGTPRSLIEQTLKAGKHLLFNIDVQGAMNLKKIYGTKVLLIFIRPPSMEELNRRLRQRQADSVSSIETRLQNAYNELRWSKNFDYEVINDKLDQAYKGLRLIIQKECP